MVSSLFGAYEYIHYKHSDVGFYGDTNFRLFRVTVHKELPGCFAARLWRVTVAAARRPRRPRALSVAPASPRARCVPPPPGGLTRAACSSQPALPRASAVCCSAIGQSF